MRLNNGKNQKNENVFLKRLEEAEKVVHLHVWDTIWLEDRNKYKIELEELREEKLRGGLIRSWAQYIDANEKPSKFFLNLENRKFVLKQKDGSSIQQPKEILKEMHLFY